jgi:hypothetical protein
VDDLPLPRSHRFERDGTPVSHSRVRRLVRHRAQSRRPPAAIPAGINHHLDARAHPLEGNALRKVLNRVQRLAMVADQRSCLPTHVLGVDRAVPFLDSHLAPHARSVGYGLEHSRYHAIPP